MDALGNGEGWKARNGVRDAGQVERSMTTSIRLQITIDHYHVLCCGFDPGVLSISIQIHCMYTIWQPLEPMHVQ